MNFIGDNFLYNELSFVESTGIPGKNGGFSTFLRNLKIDSSGAMYDNECTTVNWRQIKPHYRFFHDYVDGEEEISNLLSNSLLKESLYGYTWLTWRDPIIKVHTAELIHKWDAFHRASVEGFVFVVESGKCFCEFARYDLHSNFEIRKGSLVT